MTIAYECLLSSKERTADGRIVDQDCRMLTNGVSHGRRRGPRGSEPPVPYNQRATRRRLVHSVLRKHRGRFRAAHCKHGMRKQIAAREPTKKQQSVGDGFLGQGGAHCFPRSPTRRRRRFRPLQTLCTHSTASTRSSHGLLVRGRAPSSRVRTGCQKRADKNTEIGKRRRVIKQRECVVRDDVRATAHPALPPGAGRRATPRGCAPTAPP